MAVKIVINLEISMTVEKFFCSMIMQNFLAF